MKQIHFLILLKFVTVAFSNETISGSTIFSGLTRDPNHVQFFLVKDWKNQQKIVVNDTNSLANSGFRQGTKTFLLIDGYDSPRTPFYNLTIEAIRANRATTNDNVIIVDYRNLSGRETTFSANSFTSAFLYLSVVRNTNILGERVANFLHFLQRQGNLSLQDVHVVGMSLGCHVAGATAHYLQEKNGHNVSQNLGRITGLDPARTFYPLRMVQRLRSSNGGASFIDVYHTNRGILGEVYEGTVDLNVYVNGGIIQPGCGREDLTLVPLPGICSHLFAWEVFAASFHRDFFACPCTGSDCDCSVNCRTCSPSSDNNTAVKIGLNVSKRTRGTYHLSVTDPAPGKYYKQYKQIFFENVQS
ncbi:Endothelial lipase [Folsomia candida]|uniref:Endothelial lipase n=1 Tax=Folsomia candida TaxID=158441 RepID=A0A226E1Y6_FOLCA|nr:Endothelial lipase [Folsomia candida]